MYAEIVINKYIDMVFDYHIPSKLGELKIGSFVKIPFRNSTIIGCIVKLKDKTDFSSKNIKSIIAYKNEISPISPNLFKLAFWMKDYYGCPLGLIIKCIVPSFVFKETKRKSKIQQNILSSFKNPDFELNEAQNKAIQYIENYIYKNTHKVFLIHGVTGSGKTEIYIQCIQKALKKNKTALIIVPEISLTPQLINIFQNRFDTEIAIFHSKLKPSLRQYYWNKTSKGKIKIVLGARSAIFAPLHNLGLIVVDEEHEKSYKQEESPKYNARDIAVLRGSIENSVVILGSATPSLESFSNCQKKKYDLIELPKRISSKSLPHISLIDMEKEIKMRKTNFLFSYKLLNLIGEKLNKNEQIILFLNRRGFSTCQVCLQCGYAIKCPNCSILMTYHKTHNFLKCHRCDTSKKPLTKCSECNENKLKFSGFGTEKVEKQINKIFPNATTSRVDSDTIRKKGVLEDTWKNFLNKKIDILIGTQLIAKGLHFEGVTLVGVISADLSLNIPDFRAGETTFQLLTQVAGRTGRGDKNGEVIIQTHCINHPIIKLSTTHDYKSFYDSEIQYRKKFNYPPFNHLILITVLDKNEINAAKLANDLQAILKAEKQLKPTRLFPVIKAPISKLKLNYRFQIMIATKRIKHSIIIIQRIVSKKFQSKSKNIIIDVDPYSML